MVSNKGKAVVKRSEYIVAACLVVEYDGWWDMVGCGGLGGSFELVIRVVGGRVGGDGRAIVCVCECVVRCI